MQRCYRHDMKKKKKRIFRDWPLNLLFPTIICFLVKVSISGQQNGLKLKIDSMYFTCSAHAQILYFNATNLSINHSLRFANIPCSNRGKRVNFDVQNEIEHNRHFEQKMWHSAEQCHYFPGNLDLTRVGI